MASIARVNIFYTDLGDFLAENKLPVYGAVMDGQNLKEVKLKTPKAKNSKKPIRKL